MTGTSPEMIGRYRVIRQLASGSQGTVYHAHDPELLRDVALKVLHPHIATPDVVARFRREAQIVASINHPSIASISEIGEHEGFHFIVMEYVPHSLRELIDRGRTDIARTVRIAQQAAFALEAARTSRWGITHHDIKPDNLLLTSLDDDVVVKLIDFGIAHAADMTPMTQTGTQWGTPYYMPPEQWMGERGDTRSDVYSLGVVIYEMLTGRVPFNSTSSNSLARQNDIARQHIEDAAEPLWSVRGNVPEPLQAVVSRCMAKSPDERYQTPGELAATLANVFSAPVPNISQPVVPPPVANLSEHENVGQERPSRSRIGLITAGGVGAIIVLALVVLVVSLPSGGEPDPPPKLVVPPAPISASSPTQARSQELTPEPTREIVPAPALLASPTSTPIRTTPQPASGLSAPVPTAAASATTMRMICATPSPSMNPWKAILSIQAMTSVRKAPG